MKENKRLISLTAEERVKLEASKIEDARGCVWILGFLSVTILLGLLAGLYFLTWSGSIGLVGMSARIGVVFGFIVLSLFIMRYAKRTWGKPTENAGVAKDLLGGVKNVITETITAKNIGGKESADAPSIWTPLGHSRRTALKAIKEVPEVEVLYLITFGDKQYAIPSELYYPLNIGEAIDIHMAPNSGQILSYRVKATEEIISEIKEHVEK